MKSHKHFWKIIFIALLLIVISLLTWFISEIRDLYRTDDFRPTRGLNRNYNYKLALNPNQIQGWMTFSYINFVFNLPPNYLLGALNIQDNSYPNLDINRYIKAKDLNPNMFLSSVRESVAQYNKSTR